MKLKTFLEMVEEKADYIEVYKDKQKIYLSTITNFLNNKNNKNGVIKSWDMYVENWDYPILQITLKNDKKETTDKEVFKLMIVDWLVDKGSEFKNLKIGKIYWDDNLKNWTIKAEDEISTFLLLHDNRGNIQVNCIEKKKL